MGEHAQNAVRQTRYTPFQVLPPACKNDDYTLHNRRFPACNDVQCAQTDLVGKTLK
jgi:hypothetical protein